MASTATNKQPLLVDRPFHEGAIVNGSTASLTTDLGAAGVTGTLLLNCTNNDGALVEDVYAISRGTEHQINLYLSNYGDLLRPPNTQQNILTRYIGTIAGSDTVDTVAHFEAPFVLAPVANVGTEPRLRALYVPKGTALWATIRRDTVIEITTGPLVGVQGGYY
jgi:hypothetical protein